MIRIFFHSILSSFFLVTVLHAEFASSDINLSGLSSLSNMGKKLNHLSDLNLSGLSHVFDHKGQEENNESEENSIRPYLNQGTKNLETKYSWLYEKMDSLLMNDENIEAYSMDMAYFKNLDDLNRDGIDEIYLHSQSRCGASICNYRVYQIDTKHEKLKEIFDSYNGSNFTTIEKLKGKSWKSISIVQCWGATNCHKYTFEFDKKKKYYLLSKEKVWRRE